ncbi:hypothetical protein SOCE26_066860 [Sorangium cellulosum]|uniref:PGRS family protein n=1 Tax=Sorangium cellulosum TaxID=56 RepID=A0A2L0F0X2_SORCE|nr:hypothetical protein SOCE26_066860 [Sorangium cellulosum]
MLSGRGAVTSVVAVAACLHGAGALTACTSYSDDCWEKLACPPDPEPPPDPCEGDPATVPALDQCGVFVSEHGDDRNPGTKGAPVKTLQHAVGLAAHGRGQRESPTRRVYACGGTFKETVTLPSGVDLWGGRLCDVGDLSYEWSVVGPNQLTTIAPPTGIPLRVISGEEAATSTIIGVRLMAADASAMDHKSSIAMILSQGAKANVVSSEVVAGNGKDGEAGEDAPRERATDGVVGNDGANACTADSAVGALPVVTVCDDGSESTGGYGGDGGLDVGGDGTPGQPEPAENPRGFGVAGTGASSAPCSDGGNGTDGASGGRADGALGFGYLTFDGWIGVRGEDGKKGGVGQGGGGGGGSKSRGRMYACPTSRPQRGAAGGSGGSGGCGGKGGGGGGYGGASIAIVALEDSELSLEATKIIAGNGGDGGVGGTGQLGGVGQWGGQGGLGFGLTGMWDACDSGRGGNGGLGGDAGGGLGGAAVGIAYVVPNMAFRPGTTIEVGKAGEGGYAGNAGIGDEVGRGARGPWGQFFRFGAANEPPR